MDGICTVCLVSISSCLASRGSNSSLAITVSTWDLRAGLTEFRLRTMGVAVISCEDAGRAEGGRKEEITERNLSLSSNRKFPLYIACSTVNPALVKSSYT